MKREEKKDIFSPTVQEFQIGEAVKMFNRLNTWSIDATVISIRPAGSAPAV